MAGHVAQSRINVPASGSAADAGADTGTDTGE